MKNILIVVAVVLALMWLMKNKSLSRVELIDYLNMNVGNANGQWVNMTEDELRKVYKVVALVKRNVKPSTEDYLVASDIGKKYNIPMFLQ